METTSDSRMLGILALYDMHTDFFGRVLDGIDDQSAQNRLETRANHVAWLAGSLVQERFEMASLFGSAMEQKNHSLFDGHKGIQDGVNYPPLEEFKSDWRKISPVLREILAQLPAQTLNNPFPVDDMQMSNWEYVSFQIYREANCIGQIALWRRLLGFAPMNYM